jgi:hypothetical protein
MLKTKIIPPANGVNIRLSPEQVLYMPPANAVRVRCYTRPVT